MPAQRTRQTKKYNATCAQKLQRHFLKVNRKDLVKTFEFCNTFLHVSETSPHDPYFNHDMQTRPKSAEIRSYLSSLVSIEPTDSKFVLVEKAMDALDTIASLWHHTMIDDLDVLKKHGNTDQWDYLELFRQLFLTLADGLNILDTVKVSDYINMLPYWNTCEIVAEKIPSKLVEENRALNKDKKEARKPMKEMDKMCGYHANSDDDSEDDSEDASGNVTIDLPCVPITVL
ncbi:hypothetical protein HK097_009891 [Rhizophlyctis rosea]|uniref:Uncharacterized protein n=1 Tax=Rhizophlyctis rosea TaxID=64517 RepID=A0AAD5SAM9_9FUNG|nr:hypothetical protein HK097_009891 [Rhizophlyctis rosea]